MKKADFSWKEFSVKNFSKEDKSYPKNLLSLRQPPKLIYYRGELDRVLLSKTIGIVGSRRMTRYGASVIDNMVASLVSQGITTVSGYMYGVDTQVHTKTVEYGGKTIAVMGGGISSPYPPENDKLYTKVLQSGGAVLSEYEPEAKPKLWMYPQRNRIIAALSTVGVLVIEASQKSGSMITVKYAQKLGKKIYAVPGPITSSVSTGTNYLIKKGIAKMVTSVDDIVKSKDMPKREENKHDFANTLEKNIYDLLKNEELTIDELSLKLNKNMVETSTAVSLMCLKGVLTEAAGKYYCA